MFVLLKALFSMKLDWLPALIGRRVFSELHLSFAFLLLQFWAPMEILCLTVGHPCLDPDKTWGGTLGGQFRNTLHTISRGIPFTHSHPKSPRRGL